MAARAIDHLARPSEGGYGGPSEGGYGGRYTVGNLKEVEHAAPTFGLPPGLEEGLEMLTFGAPHTDPSSGSDAEMTRAGGRLRARLQSGRGPAGDLSLRQVEDAGHELEQAFL
jgi:hypothetical protein